MYGIISVIDWHRKLMDSRKISDPLAMMDERGSGEGAGGYITAYIEDLKPTLKLNIELFRR